MGGLTQSVRSMGRQLQNITEKLTVIIKNKPSHAVLSFSHLIVQIALNDSEKYMSFITRD